MEIGDRVQKIGQTFCGIVREVPDDDDPDQIVKVHWGTSTQAEGKPGIVILEGIPARELEPFPYAVVSADEIAERTKAERDAEVKRQ